MVQHELVTMARLAALEPFEATPKGILPIVLMVVAIFCGTVIVCWLIQRYNRRGGP